MAAACHCCRARSLRLPSWQDGGRASTARLRRAIEADRFGMVAQVLAERDGCTPDRCAALALLHDASRVSTNLAERPFEAFVKRFAASWPAAGGRPVASNPPPVAAA